MTDTPESMNLLADRFFTAVEAGDIDMIANIYAEDGIIWKSFDEIETTAAQSLAYLAGARGRLRDVKYKNIRRSVFAGGFVQQHRYTCIRRSDGKAFDFPACLVVTVQDNRFVRIEEYYDSTNRKELISGD
ncbi:ketosteroid isomerase-like protein [Hephaestia caeni]|uniref:Ketosteroid isomerase-like protein n=1 Tax=Hephaestia caeni TaxID=645617 RepID=A0A397NNJ7_9SPHN|nr:ketosteroid isomerase-like protein [Hephaestia caeni]